MPTPIFIFTMSLRALKGRGNPPLRARGLILCYILDLGGKNEKKNPSFNCANSVNSDHMPLGFRRGEGRRN